MLRSSLSPQIRSDIEKLLHGASSQLAHARVRRTALPTLIGQAAHAATGDLRAIASRDAAANNSPEYVYNTYLSFRAVLAYRIAHLVHQLQSSAADEASRRSLISAARLIAEHAKVQTGIDIHPAAIIGSRFVIDHGTGTVIGEQVEIGHDCYLLQNVTLGGRSIGNSSQFAGTRRHPIIGDRVEIGANAMVLGPVTVGSDCHLDPGARVTIDVPPRSRVRVIATLQITVTDQSPEIHGLTFLLDEMLICGLRLSGCLPVLLDGDGNLIDFLPIRSCDDRHIRCRIAPEAGNRDALVGLVYGSEVIGYITPNPAFRRI